MSWGNIKAVSASVASGASTSAGVPLGGKPWERIGVQVGTMSTAAAITIQNSIDNGATYYNAFTSVNSSATQANAVVIASSVGTNGGYIQLHQNNFTHIRLVCSAVVSGGVSLNVICSD